MNNHDEGSAEGTAPTQSLVGMNSTFAKVQQRWRTAGKSRGPGLAAWQGVSSWCCGLANGGVAAGRRAAAQNLAEGGDAEVAAAKNARLGGAVFVVIIQIVLFGALWSSPTASWDPAFLVCWLLQIVCYLRLWGSDPGWVPKNSVDIPSVAPSIETTTTPLTFDQWRTARATERFHPVTGERYCRWCVTWQPLRSRHCDMCGRCVLRFDHHCFWIGSCVGQHNHRRFWYFLLAATGFLYFAGGAVWSLCGVDWHATLGDNFSRNLLPALLLWLAIVMFLFVAGLLLYHTYLIATGRTTWEDASASRISYLRDYNGTGWPFSVGPVGNARLFFCVDPHKLPPWRLSGMATAV